VKVPVQDGLLESKTESTSHFDNAVSKCQVCGALHSNMRSLEPSAHRSQKYCIWIVLLQDLAPQLGPQYALAAVAQSVHHSVRKSLSPSTFTAAMSSQSSKPRSGGTFDTVPVLLAREAAQMAHADMKRASTVYSDFQKTSELVRSENRHMPVANVHADVAPVPEAQALSGESATSPVTKMLIAEKRRALAAVALQSGRLTDLQRAIEALTEAHRRHEKEASIKTAERMAQMQRKRQQLSNPEVLEAETSEFEAAQTTPSIESYAENELANDKVSDDRYRNMLAVTSLSDSSGTPVPPLVDDVSPKARFAGAKLFRSTCVMAYPNDVTLSMCFHCRIEHQSESSPSDQDNFEVTRHKFFTTAAGTMRFDKCAACILLLLLLFFKFCCTYLLQYCCCRYADSSEGYDPRGLEVTEVVLPARSKDSSSRTRQTSKAPQTKPQASAKSTKKSRASLSRKKKSHRAKAATKSSKKKGKSSKKKGKDVSLQLLIAFDGQYYANATPGASAKS